MVRIEHPTDGDLRRIAFTSASSSPTSGSAHSHLVRFWHQSGMSKPSSRKASRLFSTVLIWHLNATTGFASRAFRSIYLGLLQRRSATDCANPFSMSLNFSDDESGRSAFLIRKKFNALPKCENIVRFLLSSAKILLGRS